MTVRGKVQVAHDHLRAQITAGRLTPGHRLVLGPIAADLGMSVVPVREALRLLEAEGLVTLERNVGAQVALLHESEYQATMQTLSIVEGAATALSAPRVTGDHIARARTINAEMRRLLDQFDAHAFTDLNERFHSVIYEECPNDDLLGLVHRGWHRLRGLRDSSFGFVPHRAPASVDEHEHLLRMIEAGAPGIEIELSARAHRTATLDAVLAHQALRRVESDRLPTWQRPLDSTVRPPGSRQSVVA